MARATHPGSLPGELTSFVGRRRELADLRRLLEHSRLVTLTGFGGMGKTRLALRIAADTAVRDGAWLIDLAPVRDPGLVAPTVLATLGIRDESQDRSVIALADHLRDRRLLLVLDNCEHLLDACAVLVDTLLTRTSEVRVVATSRQPLGVPGERIFEVSPLPVPDPDAPVPPAQALERYDAVALFVGRAQAADLSFSISDDNAEAVTRLAQRLDGIPLALELAAARLRVLSPRQILDRLDDRNHLLTPTLRAVSPRQANLQSLIDWSFDLCTTEEQVLWARLSVFPGDFELDAVEEICSDGGLPRERVLPTLSGLVDKSIVTGTRGGTAETVRYRLLETLREYGHRLLVDEGQDAELRSRHRDHFRRLAERWSREWFGPGQVEWTHWVQVEQANLRAALEHCLSDPREAGAGLAMVVAMSTYWAHGGSLGEGRRFLDRVLATFRDPSAGRADALWTAAWIALNQGDTGTAEAAAEEAAGLAEEFGDVRALGMALLFRGSARLGRGDVQAAERLFQEALDRAGSDPVVAALALNRSGEAAAQRGDVDTATERLDRCLEVCEAHGDLWIRTGALLSRSALALHSGDLGTARRTATEALRCRLPFQDRLYVAQCVEALAWVAAAEPDHLRAARLLGAARATREVFGSSLFPHQLPFHDRCEEQSRGGLGQRDFARAEEEGSRYGITEAISYALGETVPTPDSAAAQPQVLTPREVQVADLVAEGMSNREIAARLVLSTRTAEAHVEHILTKMGFTSRSQIAAWVAERRSAEPS